MVKEKSLGIGRVLLVLSAIVLLGGAAMGQSALENMVEEGQMGWLPGRWTTTTDDGESIVLVYQWQLNKNMISVYFKAGDYSYRGMIFCVPGEEKVVEVGVDSKGSMVKSEWDATWDGAVSKREASQADGEKQSMGITKSKVDKDTMKMKLFTMEYGDLSDDAFATLEFKRQPIQRRRNRANSRTQEQK